jgi:hypothetical protein
MSARKPNFGIEYTKNVTVVKKQNAQDKHNIINVIDKALLQTQ